MNFFRLPLSWGDCQPGRAGRGGTLASKTDADDRASHWWDPQWERVLRALMGVPDARSPAASLLPPIRACSPRRQLPPQRLPPPPASSLKASCSCSLQPLPVTHPHHVQKPLLIPRPRLCSRTTQRMRCTLRGTAQQGSLPLHNPVPGGSDPAGDPPHRSRRGISARPIAQPGGSALPLTGRPRVSPHSAWDLAASRRPWRPVGRRCSQMSLRGAGPARDALYPTVITRRTRS